MSTREHMEKRERLEAAFAGREVDRPPVALWRHFPGDDQDADDLARATISFQRAYDWDFIKLTPASSFCLADWGVRDEWVGGDEGTRRYVKRAIDEPSDWARLPELDPRSGRLGDQLRCLEATVSAAEDVPVLQTVFSPLAQAKNLAGAERLLEHLRTDPREVARGLSVIASTTLRFVEACLATGMAGIYYAVQMAGRSEVGESAYRDLAERSDRAILDSASSCWFNMLHIHGTDVLFELLASYPVQAVNWHDRETAPALADGLTRISGAACGGLARWEDLLRGDPQTIRSRVADAVAQTGGSRLIVSSGCVAPVTAPLRNLRAVRAAVEP